MFAPVGGAESSQFQSMLTPDLGDAGSGMRDGCAEPGTTDRALLFVGESQAISGASEGCLVGDAPREREAAGETGRIGNSCYSGQSAAHLNSRGILTAASVADGVPISSSSSIGGAITEGAREGVYDGVRELVGSVGGKMVRLMTVGPGGACDPGAIDP